MLKSEKGLTLIEVLAAMVVLSIVVIAFMNISAYSVRSSGKDDRKAEALRLAEQKMNELKSSISPTVPPNTPLTTFPSPPPTGYNITYAETTITTTPTYGPTVLTNRVSVQAIVTLGNNGGNPLYVTRLITVTVSWEG